jgi:hypothetical protein
MKVSFIIARGGLVLVMLCTSLSLIRAQQVVKPAQTLVLTSDTIHYEIETLKVIGSLSFRDWESGGKINLYFDVDHPSQIKIGSKGQYLAVSSPLSQNKTLVPIDVTYNGVKKLLYVSFTPKFKPAFSERYEKKEGQIIFENKPLYELVNIVFALTEKGNKDEMTFNINSNYYKEVWRYFNSYRTHPLLAFANKLYEPGSPVYRMYRESAYNYSFQGDSIVVTGPYANFEEGNTVLDDLELWQDFARKSNFQKFYNDHKNVYAMEIALAKKYLPVKQMWKWCEVKLPDRYHTYRIVISPLVNGFHSTQRIVSNDFKECIMFVCGPKVFDYKKHTSKEVEGLYSGIVFTEIDHNYINPISDKYKQQLDEAFGSKLWAKKGSQAEGYGNGTGYFNEYMTHALFLLYIQGCV